VKLSKLGDILSKKKITKVAKTALGLGIGAGAAYMGIGAAFYAALLSKKSVNRDHYVRTLSVDELEIFRNGQNDPADYEGWYAYIKPQEQKLISLRGEQLYAEIIRQPEPTDKWVVICHGWTNWPQGMSKYSKFFYEKGYNILLPYSGGHGKSEKKRVTMGWEDRFDVIDWLNYLVMIEPDAKIALFGASMGAATVIMVSGEELPENVKCCIEDCGFTTLYDMGTAIAENILHIPPHIPLHAARTVTKLIGRYDLKEVAPIDQIKKSKLPTLFIHGMKDDFVPFWMMDTLYDAADVEKDRLAVPDAGHVESQEKHPELYWPKVFKFLDKYI
jgi:fermentation-respiration switch protein FrsA (DUF1100 family)